MAQVRDAFLLAQAAGSYSQQAVRDDREHRPGRSLPVVNPQQHAHEIIKAEYGEH